MTLAGMKALKDTCRRRQNTILQIQRHPRRERRRASDKRGREPACTNTTKDTCRSAETSRPVDSETSPNEGQIE